MADMPSSPVPAAPRDRASAFSINGIGYIGLGSNGGNTFYNSLWAYDPSTDSWSQKADLTLANASRCRSFSFAFNGKGYVGTGWDGAYLQGVFEYDPGANSWITKNAFGGGGRYSTTCFMVGNKVYVTGGYDGGVLNEHWEYTPASDVWTQKANIPAGRYSAVAFAIGIHGYVGTGFDGSYLSDFWKYSPVANSWKQVADIPGGARALATAFSLGPRGFVVAGSDGSALAKSDLWEYNPFIDSWVQRANFGGGLRFGAAAFVIGGSAYVGTGNNLPIPQPGNPQKDLWKYTPSLLSYNKFQKSYGGTNYDTDTTNIAFASPAPDGGYIISATTKSYGNGGNDVYLLKVGAAGVVQWAKTFGTTGNEISASVRPTSDGGYIIAGETRKSIADADLLAMKISSSGNLQWNRSVTGAQVSRANYAEETNAGGEYLVVGKGEMVGWNNTCLMRLNSAGAEIWSKDLVLTSSIDEGFSLVQTTSGNYMISGNQLPGATNIDAYVVAVTPAGNILPGGYQDRFASQGNGTDIRSQIKQTDDGGFIVCGSSNSSASHGGYDFFLLKVQNDLSISWAKSYGGTSDDIARSFVITNDGDFAVAGFTKSYGTSTDAFLSLIDPAGTPLWTKTYGGSLADKANSVYQAGDGGFVLCGETFSFANPSTTSDIYLIKTDSLGNSGCNESSVPLLPVTNMSFNNNFQSQPTQNMTTGSITLTPSTPLTSTNPVCSQCTFPLVKTKTNVKCNGGNTGSATVNPVGGTTPFTFAWNTTPVQTTATATGLSAGTYSVLVIDANACSAIDTVKINQAPPIILNVASDSVNICTGNNSTMGVNASGGTPGYTYVWSPSSGLSCSTCQNTIVSPTGTTMYLVSVSDSNLCLEKDSVNVLVHSVPAASAGPDKSICAGSAVTIGNPSSTGGVSYSWSPSSGLNNSTIPNPSANPAISTTYIITASNILGCSGKDTVEVVVISSPTVNISPSGTTTLCSGSTLSLTASSNVPNYLWSTGASTAVISVTPSASTVYYVTVTAGTCTASAAQPVSVVQSPTATITNNGSATVCTGAAVVLLGSGTGNYLWSTGATSASVSITYSVTGTYINTLTVTAGGNVSCMDIDTDTVTVVSSPVINVTATSYTLCTGISSDTLIATNFSGANYSWSPGLHPNNDTIIVGPYSVPGTITYTVSVSNGGSCTGTSTITINVSPGFPIPTVTPNPANYCFGDPLQPFTCVNPVTFVGWTDLQGNALQFGTVFTPTVTAANSYTFLCVQGTGKYCLSVPQIVKMTIHPLPLANAGKNVTICPGHTAALQASGGINYLWSPDSSLSAVNISNPSADPDSTFSWQVLVTDANGCKDRDSITVFIIQNDTCEIHVFNVITPNSDGFNEGWWIDGIASYPDNTVTIFNRWGIQVWGGINYDNKKVIWKGQNDAGEPLPTGTYYYVIHIKNKTYSKWVELVR